jgi:hypothetical protein
MFASFSAGANTLGAAWHRFGAGHRLRLEISSSSFPRFDRNPNTGEPIGRHTHMVPADQTVFGGHVVLPVIPA